MDGILNNEYSNTNKHAWTRIMFTRNWFEVPCLVTVGDVLVSDYSRDVDDTDPVDAFLSTF